MSSKQTNTNPNKQINKPTATETEGEVHVSIPFIRSMVLKCQTQILFKCTFSSMHRTHNIAIGDIL